VGISIGLTRLLSRLFDAGLLIAKEKPPASVLVTVMERESGKVLAEIPNLFGPGLTAQMTYYEVEDGAKVFAAGAFYLIRLIHLDPLVSRLVMNLWARFAPRA